MEHRIFRLFKKVCRYENLWFWVLMYFRNKNFLNVLRLLGFECLQESCWIYSQTFSHKRKTFTGNVHGLIWASNHGENKFHSQEAKLLGNIFLKTSDYQISEKRMKTNYLCSAYSYMNLKTSNETIMGCINSAIMAQVGRCKNQNKPVSFAFSFRWTNKILMLVSK